MKEKRKTHWIRRRFSAFLLSICLVAGSMPMAALAEETSEQNKESGQSGCNHIHDASCGYVEAAEGSPCTVSGGDAMHIHDESCGYREPVEGQPCNHVHDAECGGLTEEEGASEATAAPDGYITDDRGIMAYKKDDYSNTIDVAAYYNGNWIQTTFAKAGYSVRTENLNDAAVSSQAQFVNGGQYIKLSYTVTAGTTAITNGKLAVYADVQIGDNDYATINVIKGRTGRVLGISMVDDHTDRGGCQSENAQYNLYFSGTGGTTPVTTFWFGYYGSRSGNCFMQIKSDSGADRYNEAFTFDENGNALSFQGEDSGMAVSWQNMNLAPGKTATYSLILGVGEQAEPPVWNDSTDSPILVTPTVGEGGSPEANPTFLEVNAQISDEAGLTDTLYYSIDNGGEIALGSVEATGSAQTITGTIDLMAALGVSDVLPDGSYQVDFWIVNSKGAASESVSWGIVVKDGVIVSALNGGGSQKETQVILKENAPAVLIEGLDEIAEAAGAVGDEVKVVFTVDKGTESTAEGAAEIRSAAAGKALEYLNFKLSLIINGLEQPDIGNTNTHLLRIVVPFEKGNKQDITVYRYHGNAVDILTESANEGGERIEIGEAAITIYAMKFSTYAIGYTEPTDKNPEETNSEAQNPSDWQTGTDTVNSGSSKDNEPKTGDTASSLPFATIAMIAGFAYLVDLFKDGRGCVFGMTEARKNKLVAYLVRRARGRNKLIRCGAIAVIFLILVFYHSIGRRVAVEGLELDTVL